MIVYLGDWNNAGAVHRNKEAGKRDDLGERSFWVY